MLARIQRQHPTARLLGFTVQAVVRRPHAQELIVGSRIDPVFGPLFCLARAIRRWSYWLTGRSRCHP